MSLPTAGAALGGITAAGVVLVTLRIPWLRRPTLADRLDPYLRDGVLPSTLLNVARGREAGRSAAWRRVVAEVVRALAGRLDGAVGGTASIRSRLDQLGSGSVEQVRAEQVIWGGTALGVVLGLGLLMATLGEAPQPTALVLICLVSALAGVLGRDRVLTRQVTARRARMVAEFPTVAELLALSVAAGEGPIGALERVARLCSGELGREFARTLAETRAGASLVHALHQLADRSALSVLRRFVDGVVVAIERGTPLADVLRAQAVDVREAGRRALIETAARREVAMMVPVVFLVLPVTVVFALLSDPVTPADRATRRTPCRLWGSSEAIRTGVRTDLRRLVLAKVRVYELARAAGRFLRCSYTVVDVWVDGEGRRPWQSGNRPSTSPQTPGKDAAQCRSSGTSTLRAGHRTKSGQCLRVGPTVATRPTPRRCAESA